MIRPRLLCVDDDAAVRELYRKILGSFGYDVLVAEDGAHALKLFHPSQIDAVILDYEMPGMKGSEVAAELKRRSPGIPIIMVSGCPSVVDEAPRFVDAAIPKGSPIGWLLDRLEALSGAAKGRLATPAMSISRLLPLGSALATVALSAFLLPRFWK
ncbi:MAG: response regulator [Acidobacteria bacterium]|jgi:CheY-like chemotaxis protein|nr:MAG: response regulator [Acidobacteriota bacterium]